MGYTTSLSMEMSLELPAKDKNDGLWLLNNGQQIVVGAVSNVGRSALAKAALLPYLVYVDSTKSLSDDHHHSGS